MRKFTAILLALVMMCSLFGCAQKPQEQDKKPSYSLTDLLISQAVELARQMGMRADEGFMAALDMPSQVIPVASVFREAATSEPVTAKVEEAVLKTLPSSITALCAQYGSTTELACCGVLTDTIQIYMAKELEYPTAVYLRYSESCHFVVLFTPLGDNLASVWAYPLFADTAEKVLELYFSEAEDLDADQVKDACKDAANALYEAQCTEQKFNANYYIQLAKSTFQNVKPLTEKQVAKYTTEQRIISNTAHFSRLMISGVRAARVYRYPDSLQNQIDEALSSTSYSQQLQAYTQRMFCLNYPRQISNTYGEDLMVVNSILAKELNTTSLSAISSKDEAPVLVLIDLQGVASILMCIYPSEYNIYLYSYVLLPVSYTQVHSMLMNDGVKPIG